MSTFGVLESPQQRRELLRLARQTARRFLGEPGNGTFDRPIINGRAGGVFVTFWKGKALRGCMGSFVATDDIPAAVQEVTESSLQDPRFKSNPVSATELAELTIEVSILSTPAATNDPLSLVLGRHGIIVRRQEESGCFLPQVAAERGWTAEEFLATCCTTKAGLAADAWKHPKTEVLLFESESFSESDFA